MQQTIDSYAVAAFLPLAVLAIAIGLFTARRSNRSRVLLVLTCMSIAAIISITIAGRMIKLSAWGYRGVHIDWLVIDLMDRRVLQARVCARRVVHRRVKAGMRACTPAASATYPLRHVRVGDLAAEHAAKPGDVGRERRSRCWSCWAAIWCAATPA